MWLRIGQLGIGKIRLLFIPTSGHTAHTVRSTSAKHQKADFEPLRHCFDFQVWTNDKFALDKLLTTLRNFAASYHSFYRCSNWKIGSKFENRMAHCSINISKNFVRLFSFFKTFALLKYVFGQSTVELELPIQLKARSLF